MAEKSEQGPAVYYQPQGPAPPPGYYGQPPPPGQQQPPYVMVQPQQQPTVVVMAAPPGKSFAMHIALACCTFWCCGALFGLFAFIAALIAHNTSSKDPAGADRLGKISVIISVLGIIVGIIVIIYYTAKLVFFTRDVFEAILSLNGTSTFEWTFTNEGSSVANRTQPQNTTSFF